jgi:thiamine biosynthesis lipoprotein
MQKNKRQILTAFLFIAVCIAAYFLIVREQNNKSASAQIFAMDTYMELTAYGKNAEEAVGAAKDEIERLDALLSTGNEKSEIGQLNKNKKAQISADTQYLLNRSLTIYEETDGAFDITIYPVMRAWGFTGEEHHIPSEEELQSLLQLVDASSLQYDASTQTLTLPEGVEIDFGGIAKGYTSQRVAQIMQEYDINSAILNLGGNVQLVGAKPDGSSWKVAIKSPDEQEEYLGVLSAQNKAIITSGGYERYFEENGRKYHHIIDPKTGIPAYNGLQSVTIVSEDGTLADGLSTALYVMGTESAVKFWQNHNDEFDAILYTDDGNLYVTEGIADTFISSHSITVLEKAVAF